MDTASSTKPISDCRPIVGIIVISVNYAQRQQRTTSPSLPVLQMSLQTGAGTHTSIAADNINNCHSAAAAAASGGSNNAKMQSQIANMNTRLLIPPIQLLVSYHRLMIASYSYTV